MSRAQPFGSLHVSALLSLLLICALWRAADAQACSIKTAADGQCFDALVFSLSLRTDERVLAAQDTLIVLASLQTEPVSLSQINPPPPPLVGVSYLTIQRLFNLPTPQEPVEPFIIWDFGRIAQLEARLRDIDALLRALLAEFFQAQDSNPTARELILLLELDSPGIFLPTEIEALSSFALNERLQLYLSRVNVTLRTTLGPGSLTGEIELDPTKLDISKEAIGLKLSLGPASLSGVTTFEQGEGLVSQVYSIRAQVGNVELIGQATFTPTSQEFMIGASIAGLALSGSSLITPTGFTQSFFIQIPIVGSPPKK